MLPPPPDTQGPVSSSPSANAAGTFRMPLQGVEIDEMQYGAAVRRCRGDSVVNGPPGGLLTAISSHRGASLNRSVAGSNSTVNNPFATGTPERVITDPSGTPPTSVEKILN